MYGRRSKEAFKSYRNNSVEMQSQGKLVYMLYEGVIRFCEQAKRAIEEDDMATAHTNIVKAQNIIYELMNTLKLEAGEISQQLLSLYDYSIHLLVQANVKKREAKESSISMLSEVQSMINELAQAWKKIM